MTWQNAKIEAEKWIHSLDLPEDMKGQTVKLGELGKDLPFEGQFREMVLRAAARLLKSRGAKIIKPDRR